MLDEVKRIGLMKGRMKETMWKEFFEKMECGWKESCKDGMKSESESDNE